MLLYVVNKRAPQHERMRKWWESAVDGEEPIGLAWVVILGFLRLSTHPRVFDHPLTPQQAIAKIETWLALPNLKVVAETDEHWRLFKRLIGEARTIGNLMSDAHLASIAIAYGATVVSCGTDFNRFPHVRWENPVAGAL